MALCTKSRHGIWSIDRLVFESPQRAFCMFSLPRRVQNFKQSMQLCTTYGGRPLIKTDANIYFQFCIRRQIVMTSSTSLNIFNNFLYSPLYLCNIHASCNQTLLDLLYPKSAIWLPDPRSFEFLNGLKNCLLIFKINCQ